MTMILPPRVWRPVQGLTLGYWGAAKTDIGTLGGWDAVRTDILGY